MKWVFLVALAACFLQASFTLKIASFNIERFGITKVEDPAVLSLLIQILRRYELIAVQEVMSKDDIAIIRLVQELNSATGLNYNLLISDHLGRSSYREKYVYVYREDILKPTEWYHYDDGCENCGTDVFIREPFVARFSSPTTELKDFALASIHTSPDYAVREVDGLYDVWEDAKQRLLLEDILILGDYNAGCSYVKTSHWPNIRLRHDASLKWLIGDSEDTTVSTNTHCPYDRMVIGGARFHKAVVPDTAKAFNYHVAYDLTYEMAKAVSDHYPVEMELRDDRKGQCLVNGMIMYNGAAWSPQRCTICVCDQGKKVCEPLDCEEDISCPGGKLQIPPGECCPICVKTETTHVPLVSAVTLNQRKVTVQKHKEIKKDTKQMKVKIDPTKITSRPALGQNPTSNINTVTVKPPKSRKTPVNRPADVNQWKSPTKKEVNNRKQETNVQKKGVTLPNPKKEANGDKNADVEVKTRDKTIKKGTTQIPSTKKPKTPNVQTNKQEVIELFPSTPTMPSMPSFIRPTLPHIPSLPSGCLLSEFTIACANTKMTYLPLMADPGLKTLYLAENEISKLPAMAFVGLPNLEWLDLSKNKLDDSGLSHDVFKNLTKLKRLNLDGNRLTALPQLPASVQELKVNDNKLLELNRHSFRGLGNLLTLEMEGNGFHDGNVSPMTFKPLKKLIYLRLNRNHFRAIPSGLPTTIQELHLDNNRIEVVSEGILNKTLNLSVIVLSNNRLQEDRIAPRAWIHLMNVETLDLSHNRLVHVPSFLPRGAKQVILHHNQIELIPGYVFAHMKPGLEFLHLSHNHLRDDGVHAASFFGLYKSLNELLLDNNYFQSIPRGILNLKSLQVLRLSFNKIRYVPLNSICDTRVSVDSNLVSVHLENNYINRRLIPPTALSCIKTYYSVILRPQHEEYEDEEY